MANTKRQRVFDASFLGLERQDTVRVTVVEQYSVISIGDSQSWNGADLHLIRDVMRHLVKRDHCTRIGIDMQHVFEIESGFFGTLCEFVENGVAIRVYQPVECVREFFWFREYMREQTPGVYQFVIPAETRLALDEPADQRQERARHFGAIGKATRKARK